MDSCFPNALIAYKILLTIWATVASGENLLKLRLIKSYFGQQCHEKDYELIILSIEKDIVASLISNFTSKNARRRIFSW